MTHSPTRISVAKVADLIGSHPATVRRMASQGRIPTAAKIFGKITFDAAAIDTWIKEQQDEWQASTSERTSGGAGSGSEDENTVRRYEQLLKLKPGDG